MSSRDPLGLRPAPPLLPISCTSSCFVGLSLFYWFCLLLHPPHYVSAAGEGRFLRLNLLFFLTGGEAEVVEALVVAVVVGSASASTCSCEA